jgi:hypothetical protein
MLVSWQSDADAADTKSELSVKSPAAHAATAHHQHPNANAATAADTQSKHPASSAAAYSATAHHQHPNANAATAADTQSKHPASSAAAYSANVELSENEQIAENLTMPKRDDKTNSTTDWLRNTSRSRIVTSVWRTLYLTSSYMNLLT